MSENKELQTKKKVEVTFLKSPSGLFYLPYSEGEVAKLPEALANELIESGYAK